MWQWLEWSRLSEEFTIYSASQESALAQTSRRICKGHWEADMGQSIQQKNLESFIFIVVISHMGIHSLFLLSPAGIKKNAGGSLVLVGPRYFSQLKVCFVISYSKWKLIAYKSLQ